MRRKLATLLATLSAGVVLAATPVAVQAMEPYHAKNSASSGRTATIYKGSTACSAVSGVHTLYPGDIAKSTLWDSVKVRGVNDFWVYVYDGTTKVAERKYPAGTCVRFYDAHRYFIFAPGS